MPTLHALYVQNPMWIWIAVAAFFVAANLASGWARLVWPMLAALVLAGLERARVHLAWPADVAVFAVLALLGVGASYLIKPLAPRPAAEVAGGDEPV